MEVPKAPQLSPKRRGGGVGVAGNMELSAEQQCPSPSRDPGRAELFVGAAGREESQMVLETRGQNALFLLFFMA